MSTLKGQVKWFNPRKGFGFLEREDKEKVRLEKKRLEELAIIELKKKELQTEIETDAWEEVDKETASEKNSKKKPIKVENSGGR